MQARPETVRSSASGYEPRKPFGLIVVARRRSLIREHRTAKARCKMRRKNRVRGLRFLRA